MKILFMGTPDFAVPILNTLHKNHHITAVVTQPDRPKGRGHGVVFSPVKENALSLGLKVLQPQKVKNNQDFIQEISDLNSDLFVVVAYGQILPEDVLKIPALGCVNIHASLLPKYRGAAPIQRAILNGDTVTGITIMYMDKGMDTGDMILKKSMPIETGDGFFDVHNKMADLSCLCITEALKLIEEGKQKREPQNHKEATYAPMLTKEDGLINWTGPTDVIVNQVRALELWPGTYTRYKDQVLKIWECVAWKGVACNNQSSEIIPGQVLEAGDYENYYKDYYGNCTEDRLHSSNHLLVKTGDGALSITMLQGQGGKRMKASEYLRGRPIKPGEVLG